MAVDPLHGIQIKQKELNKTFLMMILNRENLWSPWFIHKYFSVVRVNHLTTRLSRCKHETLTRCWCDVGPASQTVDQHQSNIGSMFCYYRNDNFHIFIPPAVYLTIPQIY